MFVIDFAESVPRIQIKMLSMSCIGNLIPFMYKPSSNCSKYYIFIMFQNSILINKDIFIILIHFNTSMINVFTFRNEDQSSFSGKLCSNVSIYLANNGLLVL